MQFNMIVIAKIARYNIIKWFSTPRIGIILLLCIMLMSNYYVPLYEFADKYKLMYSPLVFSLLFTSIYNRMLISIIAVYLFSDAPFQDRYFPYICIRSNKYNWCMGQILYIVATSLIYSLILFILSTLTLLKGNVVFSLDWGKAIYTLAYTPYAAESAFSVNERVLMNYSAVAAFGNTIAMQTLFFCIIGITLFILNCLLSRKIGAFVAAALILGDSIISEFHHEYSIVALTDLEYFTIDKLAINYIKLLLLIIILLGIMFNLFRFKEVKISI